MDLEIEKPYVEDDPDLPHVLSVHNEHRTLPEIAVELGEARGCVIFEDSGAMSFRGAEIQKLAESPEACEAFVSQQASLVDPLDSRPFLKTAERVLGERCEPCLFELDIYRMADYQELISAVRTLTGFTQRIRFCEGTARVDVDCQLLFDILDNRGVMSMFNFSRSSYRGDPAEGGFVNMVRSLVPTQKPLAVHEQSNQDMKPQVDELAARRRTATNPDPEPGFPQAA